ncbi:MAG: DUF4007 family protein [Candidatus Schekmanbacteria bacterium]|nr:DUF4007 family protein [Candidatus Schekmanbacteria bacterium]
MRRQESRARSGQFFLSRYKIRAQRGTISRDVDCLIRTYLPARTSVASGRAAAEESFDCPLVDLGLLLRLRDGDAYQLAVGPTGVCRDP